MVKKKKKRKKERDLYRNLGHNQHSDAFCARRKNMKEQRSFWVPD